MIVSSLQRLPWLDVAPREGWQSELDWCPEDTRV